MKNFRFQKIIMTIGVILNKVKLEDYLLTEDEELSYGVKKSLAAEVLSESTTDASEGIIQDNSKVHYQLMKFIDQKKLAHEFLRKWYNIKEDGSFDQDYILRMLNIQLTKEQKLQSHCFRIRRFRKRQEHHQTSRKHLFDLY